MMMRLVFTLLVGLFSFASHAQRLPIDAASQKVVYQGRWKLAAGVSSAQGFERAKSWLLDGLVKEYRLVADTARGVLSGVNAVQIKEYTYEYLVELRVEPDGVRYRLEEFNWYQPIGTTGTFMCTVEMQLAISDRHKDLQKRLGQLNTRVGERLAKLRKQLARRIA